VKENDQIIMKPGDGFDYVIKKVSINNREPDEDSIDNTVIPHDILCLICLQNKRTHVIIECFHVVACAECAKLIHENSHECPLCRKPITNPLKKLYF